jgi:branched-chain amino acid transport system substrate-binding protein
MSHLKFFAAVLSGLMVMPAVAAEPIKVGIMLPVSGVFASVAAEILAGMKIALEESNNEVSGRPVDLIIADDQSRPNIGVTQGRKLIQSDNVDVLAGFVVAAVTTAVRPLAVAAKVPMVVTMSSANALTGEDCSPWLFRLGFSNDQVALPLADYLANSGVKKVVIVAGDFATPREIVATFRKSFESKGGEVLEEMWSPIGETKDFGPYLTRARARNPDAILASYYGAEAILFTKQYQSFDLQNKIKLVSTLGLNSQNLRQAQRDSAAGITTTVNYYPELGTAESEAFQKKYKEKNNGAIASEIAVAGYDSLRFILEGLKSLGGKTDDKAALARAIAKVSYTGPRGLVSLNSSNNNVVQAIYVTESTLNNGEVVSQLRKTFPNFNGGADACRMSAL